MVCGRRVKIRCWRRTTRSARVLFSDSGLSNQFQAGGPGGSIPPRRCWPTPPCAPSTIRTSRCIALAVSTDHGGSAVPARDAGVPHYDDCSLMLSPPITEDATPPSLDDSWMHRLETINWAEYVRLTSMGGKYLIGTPADEDREVAVCNREVPVSARSDGAAIAVSTLMKVNNPRRPAAHAVTQHRMSWCVAIPRTAGHWSTGPAPSRNALSACGLIRGSYTSACATASSKSIANPCR